MADTHEGPNAPAADWRLNQSPVVFLHGQPGAGTDWAPVIRALPAEIHSIAPDRPGYRSSRRPPGSFTENAQWLLDELDDAGQASAILVGHSYGGGVALTAAGLAPERVRGLVLIASVGPHCLDGWDTVLAAPVIGAVCAVAAWWLTPWFARQRLARLERVRGRSLEADEYLNLEAWGNARHETGAMWRTFLTEQRELVGNLDQLTGRLDQVIAPTLVIADPADKMIPAATAHALHEAIPTSRLVLVADGGHQLPRRRPHVVADEIVRFCAQLD